MFGTLFLKISQEENDKKKKKKNQSRITSVNLGVFLKITSVNYKKVACLGDQGRFKLCQWPRKI